MRQGAIVVTAPHGDPRSTKKYPRALKAARIFWIALVTGAFVLALLASICTLRHDRYFKPYGGCSAPMVADDAGLKRPSPPLTPANGTPASGADTASALPAATLKVDQATTVAFGRSTRPKSLVVYFSLSQPLPPDTRILNVRVDPFKRGDDARLNGRASGLDSNIMDNAIHATATPDGRELRLEVCFGRQGNEIGNPGTYNGTVTLTDFRLASDVTVPITVTMQYIHGTLLFWLVLAAVLPGTWLLWVTKRKVADSNARAFDLEILDWVLTIGGIVAVVTGTVAAFSVYVATYLKDPTWGTSAFQPISLYGAMFSAFVATSGIAHAGTQSHGTTGAQCNNQDPPHDGADAGKK